MSNRESTNGTDATSMADAGRPEDTVVLGEDYRQKLREQAETTANGRARSGDEHDRERGEPPRTTWLS